jgi:NAD(P)-dependent dehydrogenase (short-subunit alcohol dehydrogenase family)
MRGQGGGAIINTASISGMGGDYGMAYLQCRQGRGHQPRAAAIENAKHKIRINCICPGGGTDAAVRVSRLALVEPKGLFVQIARQMERRDADVGAFHTTLEARPKILDPVRVNVAF